MNLKLKEVQKAMGFEDDVREYSLEWGKQLHRKIWETIDAAKEHAAYKNRNFYIVLIKNRDVFNEKAKDAIHVRVSCPTPVYKQDVFKYHHLTGSLEFLWCIPDKLKYYHILNNKQRYYENKETRRQCQFVVLMESGELLKWVKKENGELPDAVLSIKSDTKE